MKYDIYQIVLTKEDTRVINSMENPHGNHPKFRARLHSQIGEYEAAKGHYEKVAEIEGNDLEHVFHISNCPWDREELEPRITRLTERMHSVSVGDIVVDGNGIQWGVADIGFDEVQEVV